MRDVKDVGYDELVALRETSIDMPVGLVVFNQTCLLIYWKSKRKAT